MGCSAAKNLTVEPIDTNKVNKDGDKEFVEPRKVSIPNDVPPLESEDPQVEILEAATNVNNVQKGSNGLSFEIAFEDTINEPNGFSLIKKHPPKRFQKLEKVDDEMSPKVTLGQLQEKLEEAEIRRQQILQQRIQSAKYRNNLKKQNSSISMHIDGHNSEDDDHYDYLKIPDDYDNKKDKHSFDVSYL